MKIEEELQGKRSNQRTKIIEKDREIKRESERKRDRKKRVRDRQRDYASKTERNFKQKYEMKLWNIN